MQPFSCPEKKILASVVSIIPQGMGGFAKWKSAYKEGIDFALDNERMDHIPTVNYTWAKGRDKCQFDSFFTDKHVSYGLSYYTKETIKPFWNRNFALSWWFCCKWHYMNRTEINRRSTRAWMKRAFWLSLKFFHSSYTYVIQWFEIHSESSLLSF